MCLQILHIDFSALEITNIDNESIKVKPLRSSLCRLVMLISQRSSPSLMLLSRCRLASLFMSRKPELGKNFLNVPPIYAIFTRTYSLFENTYCNLKHVHTF